MWITRTSINQPVFATMVILALCVLGAFSYRLLPVEQMPEVNPPMVWATVQYPGASPEAIDLAMRAGAGHPIGPFERQAGSRAP